MANPILLSLLAFGAALDLAAASRYETILLPNPSRYLFTHVSGLNSRGVVLTESPADNYPFGSCENLETRFCTAAIWSEREGRQALPQQDYSDYLLNEKGEVGGYRGGSGHGELFVWTPQRGFRVIGTIQAIWCANPRILAGFNDRGEITGIDCIATARGFFASEKNGTVYLAKTGTAWPIAFNDQGEVIGYSNGGFYWTEKKGMVELSAQVPSLTSLVAIDDQGTVLGTMTKNGSPYFFLWDPRRGVENTVPQGPNCTARFVRSGVLLGTCPGPPNTIWTWTDRSGVRPLGTLPAGAQVHGANNDGQVVGEYRNSAGTQHAFVWTPGWEFVDLDPDHPTRPSLARFINDDGLIAGEFGLPAGYFSGGWADAVVWKPVKGDHGESRH